MHLSGQNRRMNVSLVIPAKGTSTRVKNKNLYEVEGKSLVRLAFECGKMTRTETYVPFNLRRKLKIYDFLTPETSSLICGRAGRILNGARREAGTRRHQSGIRRCHRVAGDAHHVAADDAADHIV